MSDSSNTSNSNQGVEFRLFAPYNDEVALIGNWNDWQRIAMAKDDKGWWHTWVPLADGEYLYQFAVKSKSFFMVDEWVDVADPRAVRLTMEFPERTRLIVLNGKRAPTTYQWKNDDKPLPANDALVIYELHVGDFSGGPGDDTDGKPKGHFQNVIDKLDYLASLGINAIELMPCNEFPGERSWGYNPRSIFAVENNYGTPNELCQLIDECHGRGIRVIHDGVYNHSEDKAPLTMIDHDYWYYHENPDEPDQRFGPKLNYEHFDDNLKVWPARQHVRDAIVFWIENFHIDGVRFDATYLIRNYDFLSWLHSEIFKDVKSRKPFYTIAENIPQDPSIAGPNGPLDAAWHEDFMQQVNTTVLGVENNGYEPFNLEALAAILDPHTDGFSGAFNVVNYLDNHDHNRIMWDLGAIAKTFDGSAFRRAKLGAAILMTAPGVPMIWMGEEFGFARPKSMEWERLDWTLFDNEANADLMRYYSGLIKLRTSTAALQGESGYEAIYKNEERCILAYKRWDNNGGIVVVVVNVQGDYEGGIEIPNWPGDGKWHEYIYNYDVEVQGGTMTDTLSESEVKIYIKA
ncbi:MAG: alpha-amylase family glycosyl hydrolase [Chloroflexota bacterium]